MLLRCLPLAVFFLFLILFIAGQAQHRLNFLCDSHTNLDNESESRGGHKYLSCVAKTKLKLLVIEYGFVDAMTGAANRHLGLLTVLGSLGHTIKRASLRVGMTKKLPPLAKGVFEGMHIEQHPKRLLNFRHGSTDVSVGIHPKHVAYDSILILSSLHCTRNTLH